MLNNLCSPTEIFAVLLHMGFDNHYNCVDEHDYNQRMQILLPFDRVFPLL